MEKVEEERTNNGLGMLIYHCQDGVVRPGNWDYLLPDDHDEKAVDAELRQLGLQCFTEKEIKDAKKAASSSSPMKKYKKKTKLSAQEHMDKLAEQEKNYCRPQPLDHSYAYNA